MASQISVGLQKILQLLTSEDPDVQIHAVKVVANLAAEGVLHFSDIYILADSLSLLFLSLTREANAGNIIIVAVKKKKR